MSHLHVDTFFKFAVVENFVFDPINYSNTYFEGIRQ